MFFLLMVIFAGPTADANLTAQVQFMATKTQKWGHEPTTWAPRQAFKSSHHKSQSPR